MLLFLYSRFGYAPKLFSQQCLEIVENQLGDFGIAMAFYYRFVVIADLFCNVFAD